MYGELYDLAKSGDYDIAFSGANYYQQGQNGDMVYSRTAVCKQVCYETQEECRKNVMDFFPTTTIFDVPWNKLYKRELVVENGVKFRDIRRCQDAMFNLDVYHNAKKVVACDKAYYNYMENTQADVWRKFPKTYYEIIIVYNTHLIELLKEWGVYEGEIKKHYDTSFVIGLYESAKMCDNPNWDLSKKEQKEYVEKIFSDERALNALSKASVREEEKYRLQIVLEKDVKAFFKEYKREKFKDKLRKNKVIRAIYKLIKG
jgi:hypothetical protein